MVPSGEQSGNAFLGFPVLFGRFLSWMEKVRASTAASVIIVEQHSRGGYNQHAIRRHGFVAETGPTRTRTRARGRAVPDEAPPNRGSLQFLITPTGDLVNGAINVRLLAQLWADRTLIRGVDLGPGDPGDFDHGAWHSSCHLLGAGGACRATDGRILWLEVSHLRSRDEYFASVTFRDSGKPRT